MRKLLLGVLLLAAPAWSAHPLVEPICEKDKKLCAQIDALLTEVVALAPAEGEPQKLSVDRLRSLQERASAINKLADAYAYGNKMQWGDAVKLFGPSISLISLSITRLSLTGAPLALKDLGAAMGEAEGRLGKLEKDVEAGPLDDSKREEFALRLALINSEGTRLWRHMQDAALLIDRSGNAAEVKLLADGTKKPVRTPIGDAIETSVNPLQIRVAELSRRIRALDAKLGGPLAAAAAGRPSAFKKDVAAQLSGMLVDPFAQAGAPQDGGGATTLQAKGRAATLPRGPPAEPRAPHTLLDFIPVPAVEGEPSETQWYTGGKRDSEPEETKKVALMRKTGLSRTIGDPKGRAALVFEQTGNTCAITSQIQVLQELGTVKSGKSNCRKAEDALYERAIAKDLFIGSAQDPLRRFRGGTPGTHLAALLPQPAVKRYAATEAELFQAVSRGKLIIAAAETGQLWNDPNFANAGHVFVITGAEVNSISGAVLGYYINDTGTNEGGRFISATQFHRAWKANGSVFVEPQ